MDDFPENEENIEALPKLMDIFKDIFWLRYASGEDQLANQVAIKLRNLSIDGKLRCVWFHVPNEIIIRDKRDVARLRKQQAIGQISGAPDIVFMKKGKCLCVELKKSTGQMSESQRRFKQWCEFCKTQYVVAKSLDDVLEALVTHKFMRW